MAYAPIAYIAPYYNPEQYANWWLKAYVQGTTTPRVMALNESGSPTVAKLELNQDGFLNTAAGALTIPFIDGPYDLWLFPTEAEADADDTSNAIQLADDIETDTGSGNNIIYKDTVAEMQAIDGITEGLAVRCGERADGLFVAEPFAGLDNGYNILPTPGGVYSFVLRQGNRVNLEQYGQSAGAEQAAVDYLESLAFPGGVIECESNRSFSGVTQTKLISWVGTNSSVVNFTNDTAGATMIDLAYSGITDIDKRNFIQFDNIRFTDEASGTGKGIHSNLFFFIEINRCFFEGFTAGYGLDLEETLWVHLNNVNTDQSNVRLKSVLDPHFNNIVKINGGEFRNPTTFGLEIDNFDIIEVGGGWTMEGDLSNTTTPTRAISISNGRMLKMSNFYCEFLRTGDAALKIDNVDYGYIDTALLNTNDDTVPAVIMNNCKNFKISESVLAGGLQTTGSIGNVEVVRCGIRGLMDILPGHGVTFKKCSPLDTAGAIPVDPTLQSETFVGEGVPMKNWYVSSSFGERDPTLDTTGTATMSYDTAAGYHDTNSLKITATGVQTCVFSSMGTTDTLNDGAIITFMAKANINTQVDVQGSISTALGTAFCKFTTDWKRYFVFTQLSTAAAGTGISATFTTSETCVINIDDIQTVAYQNFEQAADLFSNFRHIPTHGTRITALEQRSIRTFKTDFDRGTNHRKHASAPISPKDGDMFHADGSGWDPLAQTPNGSYFVWYNGSAYLPLNKTANGTLIT